MLVLGHVTLGLTVMGSRLLLLQVAPPVRQASTAQALARRVLVLGHVTLGLTVMGSRLLLLQLAPLALQATTQVPLARELPRVLYAEQERTAQLPT